MATNEFDTVDKGHLEQEPETFDFYSCDEAVKRLNDYLDHELTADERADVVKHLHLCKPCFERFHFEENLMVSIRTKFQAMNAPTSLRSKLSHLFHK